MIEFIFCAGIHINTAHIVEIETYYKKPNAEVIAWEDYAAGLINEYSFSFDYRADYVKYASAAKGYACTVKTVLEETYECSEACYFLED